MIGWSRTAKREAIKAAKNARNAVCDAASELCEGNIQLEITPFKSFSQINKYKKYLATIKELRIMEENWSEDDGFNILVSVQVPLALGRLLQDMPEVARVQLNGRSGNNSHKQALKKMVVIMKSPAELETVSV
jgi:hypothetical protein